MSRTKKREMKAPREMITLNMLLHCKGGKMRHKNDRRTKDAGKIRKEQSWDE